MSICAKRNVSSPCVEVGSLSLCYPVTPNAYVASRPEAPNALLCNVIGMERNDPPDRQTEWPSFGYWVRVGIGIVAVVVTVLLVLVLKTVILLVLASLVLAIGLQPPIAAATRRGMSRGVALTLILTLVTLPVVMLVVLALPVAVDQAQEVADTLPSIRAEIAEFGAFGEFLAERMDPEALVPDDADVGRTLGAVAGTGFNVFTVLVLTPYFAVAYPRIKTWLLRMIYREQRADALDMLNESSERVSNYVLGNVAISVIAGIVAYVGFQVIGVESALILAVWIAVTDLIPIVGAFIGAIPAIAVAGLHGLGPAVAVAVLLLVYQLVENYAIAPHIMKNAIDLSPPAVIVAIMVGSAIAGVLGALLALPLAAVLKLAFHTWVVEPRIDAVRDGSGGSSNTVGRTRNLP